MRLTTKMYAKFESVGKPSHTVRLDESTMQEIILEFAKWIPTIHMGSHLRIIVGRSPHEVDFHSGSIHRNNSGTQINEDMLAQELESMLAQANLNFDEGDE